MANEKTIEQLISIKQDLEQDEEDYQESSKSQQQHQISNVNLSPVTKDVKSPQQAAIAMQLGNQD